MTTGELTLRVTDIAPELYAVTPSLTARVAITTGGEPVHAMALRAQVRIAPARRGYSDTEAAALVDLFGPRHRWSDTQQTFLWQHTSTMVPGFTGTSEVSLPLLCTYDFEVAAAKYLHALRDGAVPLQFLFSGTIFTSGRHGFSVQQVPWDRDQRYEMPVRLWRDLMAQHYPNGGWVRLDHHTVAALAEFKAARGLLDLDAAVGALLETAREDVP